MALDTADKLLAVMDLGTPWRSPRYAPTASPDILHRFRLLGYFGYYDPSPYERSFRDIEDTYAAITNPTNIKEIDGIYGTIGPYFDNLYTFFISNEGRVVPSGATITGFQIRVVSKSASNDTFLDRIQVYKGFDGYDVPVSSGSGLYPIGTTDTEYTFGGSTELFGTTWTSSDRFGIEISFYIGIVGTDTLSIDGIELTTWYSDGSSQTITITVASATASASAPTVTPGAATITAPTASSTASATPPTVTPGTSTVTVTTCSATAAASAPTITPTVSIVSPTASATAAATAPSVTAGATTITITTASATAAATAPDVTNATLITPGTVQATATASTPTVTPGSASIVPPAATATAAAVDVTVQAGTSTITVGVASAVAGVASLDIVVAGEAAGSLLFTAYVTASVRSLASLQPSLDAESHLRPSVEGKVF